MAVSSAISSLIDNTVGQKVSKAKSTMDMQDFLKLLTEQLANQNPLEPMNDRDFFAQMAQLGNVQGMDKLTNQSEIQQIQEMIGKEVTGVRPMTEGTTGTNDLVTGTAVSMKVLNGVRYVVVQEPNGGTVDMKPEQIQTIRAVTKASDYMNLVGKKTQVAVPTDSAQGYVERKGEITRIEINENRAYANVKTESGDILVPVDSLVSIGTE